MTIQDKLKAALNTDVSVSFHDYSHEEWVDSYYSIIPLSLNISPIIITDNNQSEDEIVQEAVAALELQILKSKMPETPQTDEIFKMLTDDNAIELYGIAIAEAFNPNTVLGWEETVINGKLAVEMHVIVKAVDGETGIVQITAFPEKIEKYDAIQYLETIKNVAISKLKK